MEQGEAHQTLTKQGTENKVVVQTEDGKYSYARWVSCESNSHEEIESSIAKFIQFDHPNVLKLRQCLKRNNSLLLREEYSQEGNLIESVKAMKINSRKAINDIAKGVHYLHSKKLIHERLSLQCIVFREGCALIGDIFRLKGLQTEEEIATIYSPPEAREGLYGYASDIWSLGIIFLEITLQKAIGPQADSLVQYLSKVEDLGLRQLIQKMTSFQPEMRPSISEVLTNLGIPVLHSPMTAKEVVSKLLQKIEDFQKFKLSAGKLEILQTEYLDLVSSQAKRGDASAMYIMGRIFHTSSSDAEMAKEWLLKAAEAGEIRAFPSLFILSRTMGLPDINYLRKGVELNDSHSRSLMERQLLQNPSCSGVDHRQAQNLLKRLPKEAAKLALIAVNKEGYSIIQGHQRPNLNGVIISRAGDTLTRRRWYLCAVMQGSTIAYGNLRNGQLF